MLFQAGKYYLLVKFWVNSTSTSHLLVSTCVGELLNFATIRLIAIADRQDQPRLRPRRRSLRSLRTAFFSWA